MITVKSFGSDITAVVAIARKSANSDIVALVARKLVLLLVIYE